MQIVSQMKLNVFSVTRTDYRNGNFPLDCTHVLRVGQTDGFQLFVGSESDLTFFASYIYDLISVRSVKLSLIDDYE